MMRDNPAGVELLHISVTDQFNILCSESRVVTEKPPFADEPLTFDKIETVARSAVSSGIRRVRITGGEPLLRPGLVDLIRKLSAIPGIMELSLLTNATLLAPQALYLKTAGLDRINVCLDTFDPEKYPQLTGTDLYPRVREGIKQAMLAGFSPVYIDVVTMRGINTDEVDDLIALCGNRSLVIRFVELVPSMGDADFFNFHYVSSDAVYSYLSNRYWLEEIPPGEGFYSPIGTYYRVKGLGTIALLSPYSMREEEPLSRLRVSAKGILKISPDIPVEADLRPYLEKGDTKGLKAALYRFVSGEVLNDLNLKRAVRVRNSA